MGEAYLDRDKPYCLIIFLQEGRFLQYLRHYLTPYKGGLSAPFRGISALEITLKF